MKRFSFHVHHLHLHSPLGGVLPHQLTRSVKELFASVGILGFAVSAASLFEPIYLYTLHYSVLQIIGYNVIIYALYFVLIPLGAKFALRYGVERSILVGSSVLILYFLALFGVGRWPMLFFIAPVINAVSKMFYWVGYHADFAQFSTQEEVGREIGGMSLVIGITTMFGPVAGGAIIAVFGFPVLFIIVAILILLSNIPLFASPALPARASFSYTAAFRRLFLKKNAVRVFTSLGYGEDFVMLVLWPIFIFLIVGNTESVGLLVTFASLFTSVILLYLGRLTDLKNRFQVLWAGVSLKVLAWVIRIAVTVAPQILVVDSVYRIASGATEYPILTETYTAAKQGSVMETVVIFEMSLIIGKLLMMAAIAILVLYVHVHLWPAIFVLAAAMSFLYGSLSFRRAH